jgi:hypothetical protein
MIENRARILSSFIICFAYIITMYHDTTLGCRLYLVGNSLAIPYMIRHKCWDIVALLSFLNCCWFTKGFLMKFIVDLYVGGKVFKEQVQANNQKDARETALARNPTAKVIGVNVSFK